MHCFSVCVHSLIYINAIGLQSSHRIHRVLVSGPPWIPRSDDAQVLCIKRHSTVSLAHPRIQNPWIQRADFYVSFHLLPLFSSTVFKTHPCHCANMEPTASNWCNKLQGVHPLIVPLYSSSDGHPGPLPPQEAQELISLYLAP